MIEARGHGVDVVAAADAADALEVDATRFEADAGLDLVVAIGGDGTVLKAVRIGRGSRAPVFGINDGRLGFLAEGAPHDLPHDRQATHIGKGGTHPIGCCWQPRSKGAGL